MTKDAAGLRTGPKDSYHDKVFEDEINNLINVTKEHYELYAVTLLLASNMLSDRAGLLQDILQGRHEVRLLRTAVGP